MSARAHCFVQKWMPLSLLARTIAWPCSTITGTISRARPTITANWLPSGAPRTRRCVNGPTWQCVERSAWKVDQRAELAEVCSDWHRDHPGSKDLEKHLGLAIECKCGGDSNWSLMRTLTQESLVFVLQPPHLRRLLAVLSVSAIAIACSKDSPPQEADSTARAPSAAAPAAPDSFRVAFETT